MFKKIMLFLVVFCSLFISACSHTVSYQDTGDTYALSTDFGSNDLQQIAGTMVDSLLTFPPIVQITSTRRPVVLVDRIKNKTRQHIDTEAVTDSIRTKLIRSGKFRFIDRNSDASGISEVRYQQESGLVDQRTAVKFGKQAGAEYMLIGSIMDITQRQGRETDVYYKFTLSLKNLSTGILEWSDEKEIKKLGTKPLFGW